ncbi:MAG: hypothetical protein NTV34_09985, partial [Proteobacteria bacterium]|nr:hypothetical protein [Pseudomonadota bacterium]
SPNAEGFSGRSLFNELVWEGRNCDVGDSTPLCKVLNGLISEYLFNGADPDSVFDNQEGWTPRPVWEYLLSSYAQRGKVRRLDLAEQIFFELLSKQPDGKLTEALKVRLNGLLLEFSKNPYLGAAVQKLVKFGANIDIVDAEGNSSLIIAATVGAGDTRPFRNLPPPAYMVAVLVKSGADISLKNLGGKTALEILEAKRSDLTSDANQVKLFEITCDLLKNGKSSLEKAENDLLALGYAPISN